MYLKLRLNMMEFAKGVLLGKMSKDDVLVVIVDSKESWILCILMFVGLCRTNPWLVICTVTFIDDYSCKTWIYFLKLKNEVFEKFREFKVHVENATGKTIKTLRSDNGGEYVSKALIAFSRDAGIKRSLIVPYYPQQNGIVERKNITIVEVAKAMLHDQELPMLLREKLQRQLFMFKIDVHNEYWITRLLKNSS